MNKFDQIPDSDFIKSFCQLVDDCHGKRPDQLWFSTWMASKSPYFEFPQSFESFWQSGSIKDDFPLGKRLIAFFSLGKTLASLSIKAIYCRWGFRVYLSILKNDRRRYNVLKTFAYAPDNKKPDPFWNQFAEALGQDPHPLLTLYDPTFSFRRCKDAYSPDKNNIPYFAFLSVKTLFKDYFRLGLEALAPKDYFVPLLTVSYKKALLHPSSLVHLSFLNCFKNIFETISMHQLYITYENNPWEKMAYLARDLSHQKFKIIGFQHASIPKDAANYFLSEYENKKHLYPDTVFTVGNYTAKLLASYPGYKNARIKAGCALRHQYLENMTLTPANFADGAKILVVLDGTRDTVNILTLIHGFLEKNPEFKNQMIIKEHPNMPIALFAPEFLESEFVLNKKLHISKETLQHELNECNIVIYSGSTVCIEALKVGRAVINCNFTLFNYDPLFQFHDFKWQASNPDDLVKAIAEIEVLPNDEIIKKQTSGMAFVNEYFLPCTKENIEGFLIP